MSLDCVREAADCARLDPCVQELRTTQLTIRVVQWTGERAGQGDKETISELVMPKYEVREVGTREILSSGGKLTKGDIVVKDITPAYQKSDGSGQGGYTRDQLDPQAAWNAPDFQTPVRRREVEYVLSGDESGIFTLYSLNTSDPTAWFLTLRNTRKTP